MQSAAGSAALNSNVERGRTETILHTTKHNICFRKISIQSGLSFRDVFKHMSA